MMHTATAEPSTTVNTSQVTFELDAAVDLLEYTKERLVKLSLKPDSHILLRDLEPSAARLISDQLKSSYEFARGVLGFFDRETYPGENHSGMLLCRGASASANSRLKKCLGKIENKIGEDELAFEAVDRLKSYINEVDNYLNSFGGTNPFFPEQGETQINGAHHSQLRVLAHLALEFAGE